MNNPFSVWYEHNGQTSQEPVPSVYGALPMSSTSQVFSSGTMTFTFTGLNPSILNCTIVGPNNAPYFYVVTDPAMSAYTLFKTTDGKSFGLVEWGQSPKVEVRGAVAKQSTSQFLRLSNDQRFRVMSVSGQEYMWIPGQGALVLYPAGVTAHNSAKVAQIKRSRAGNYVLEIDQNAARAGLLNPCIVAATLLQSGHVL